MKIKSVLLSIFLTASTLNGVTAPAYAQNEGPSDEAKAAFKEGLEHFEAGRSSEAAEAFRRAHRLSPSWKLWYNVGQSEMGAKRFGLALEAFEHYLVEGGDEVDETRRAKVQAEIDTVRKLVGFIDVEAPQGSAVLVDGVERGTAPLDGSLPVAASVKHTVSAVMDGRVIGEHSVRVMGERKETVTFIDGRKLAAPTEVSEESQAEASVPPVSVTTQIASPENGNDKERLFKIIGWSGVAGGLLVGGLSGVFFGLAASSKNDFEAAQNDYDGVLERLAVNPNDADALQLEKTSWEEMDTARRDNSTQKTLGVVFAVSGGVLMAAGATFLLLNDEESERDAIALTVLPGGIDVRF